MDPFPGHIPPLTLLTTNLLSVAFRQLAGNCGQVSKEPRLFAVGLGPVRICGQVIKKLHELARLTDEKSVGGESLDGSHRSPLGFGWTNNRTGRETSVKEWARLRHDQVGL